MEGKQIRIALDAMGGDNAPVQQVLGAVEAVRQEDRIKVFLVGDRSAIEKELSKYPDAPKDRLEIVHTTQVIETAEPPVAAIRTKKDSSIVVGLNLVKKGEADAFVSSGSTGAVLVGGTVIAGRIKGVERAPLGVIIPTGKGQTLLIDGGANVDARPSHLLQFARMGSIYMENVHGISNPTVGIVNNGAEEDKGNALVKETFPLLKEMEGIHFIGSVEPRDIPFGAADVVVCEAFVGNAILKMYEGTSTALMGVIKEGLMDSWVSKIGALMVKPALKKAIKKYDPSEYGGAPLLGLKGLVVKAHGSARAGEVRNALMQCVQFSNGRISEKIEAAFAPQTAQNSPSEGTVS